MSEMIERVAKLIRDIADKAGERVADDVSFEMARAVIEAMRDPTEEMIREGSGFAQSEFAWEAMIDAALK